MGNKNSGGRGKQKTAEHRLKISNALKGKKKTEQHIIAIKGYVKTKEHLENLKASLNKQETKDKRQETMLNKYGVQYATQLPENNMFRWEFWVKRGLNKEESVNYISLIQKNFCYLRKTYASCWKKDYWLNKGFSEEESIKKVSEIQSNNAKLSKVTKSKVEEKFIELLEKNIGKEVLRSQKLCNRFLVDGLILKHNIVIEVFGVFWHMHPSIFNENDINRVTGWKAKSKWAEDNGRIKYLEKAGYKVFVVWENDNFEEKIKQIKQEIKQ